MNSTQWSSLTDLVKYLGREGICRVAETEKGLEIAFIDRSPEAIRRQETTRVQERKQRGDEERKQAEIRAQIERAWQKEYAEVEKLKSEEDHQDTTQDDEAIHSKPIDTQKITFGLSRVSGNSVSVVYLAIRSPKTKPELLEQISGPHQKMCLRFRKESDLIPKAYQTSNRL